MAKSLLQHHPKSNILEEGYIHVYSQLNEKEKLQLFFNRQYKKNHPDWDNTMIVMCRYFEEAMLAIKTKSLTVLDAGCGNGNYVIDEFRRQIAYACGVDIDKKATEKNICLDEILFSDLTRLPYPDNHFDIVLSLWVIEHLRDPKAVFQQISRVLKPNGYFIFCTPNQDFLFIRLKRILKSSRINNRITNYLYGREEEDIFDTFYKANTVSDLDSILSYARLQKVHLSLNYDPGYTSFNNLSFNISNAMVDTMGSLLKPHITGMYKK